MPDEINTNTNYTDAAGSTGNAKKKHYFGNVPSDTTPISITNVDTSKYPQSVISYAELLKGYYENPSREGGPVGNSDSFYIEYAQRAKNFENKSLFFGIVMNDKDACPDAKFAQYSYEEILEMVHNGVYVPKNVIAWAQAHQEADVTDYIVIDDTGDTSSDDGNYEDNDINTIRKKTADYIKKSTKAQGSLETNNEKMADLSDSASAIKNRQKEIAQNNSLDKTETLVDEWKRLEDKQKNGKLTDSEKARYKELSRQLQKTNAAISELKATSQNLENFLNSIDNLAAESYDALDIAKDTIDSAMELSKLNKDISDVHITHTYQAVPSSADNLSDNMLNGMSDEMLSYTAERYGRELEAAGNATTIDINSDEKQDLKAFAQDYTRRANSVLKAIEGEETQTSESSAAPTDKQTETTAASAENEPEPTVAPFEEPSEVPSVEPTTTPVEEPSETPTAPTIAPVEEPSETPSAEPTTAPVEEPSEVPSVAPTTAPVEEPSETPSIEPTTAPVEELSEVPSVEPTTAPVEEPSETPSAEPTTAPVEEPTEVPSVAPTTAPVEEPTEVPSVEPTTAPVEEPSEVPSVEPTTTPVEEPTEVPSVAPTTAPVEEPSEVPSVEPTTAPVEEPTEVPSVAPTTAPIEEPSEVPSVEPTTAPIEEPSEVPSVEPTTAPIEEPSEVPSVAPTTAPVEEPTEVPSVEPTTTPVEEPSEIPSVEPTTAPVEEPTEAPSVAPAASYSGAASAVVNTNTSSNDSNTRTERKSARFNRDGAVNLREFNKKVNETYFARNRKKRR